LRGDILLGFVAIGAAASIAGMIWPFRRGYLGIVVNFLAGVTGAIVGPLLSFLILPWARGHDTPARLFFAALGAIAALCGVHLVWNRRARRRTTRAA
jgi:uncharacterized membrane protein YeaQ/YmgE (transglycosylase-associated protein family)